MKTYTYQKVTNTRANKHTLLRFSRISALLRSQEGNDWCSKLPPNPDAGRVLAALTAASQRAHATASSTQGENQPAVALLKEVGSGVVCIWHNVVQDGSKLCLQFMNTQ